MKEVEYDQGREQTYLKHFFLERYLERVAYVIGGTHPEFIYVDGFSGPWRSQAEAFEDTSFIIALRKLRRSEMACPEREGAPVCGACSSRRIRPRSRRSGDPSPRYPIWRSISSTASSRL